MDSRLIVRAQRGDERAFADLTTAIGARLHRVALGILRDRDLAEDAMQAALVQIWRSLPSLRDPSSFEAWTTKLLVNACYAEAKRAKRWLPHVLEDVSGRDDLRSVLDRDQIERAFARLSLDQRTVLVLRYYLDQPAETVASVLGVPVGTVHSRLHRATDAMRSSLAADARPTLVARTDGGAGR